MTVCCHRAPGTLSIASQSPSSSARRRRGSGIARICLTYPGLDFIRPGLSRMVAGMYARGSWWSTISPSTTSGGVHASNGFGCGCPAARSSGRGFTNRRFTHRNPTPSGFAVAIAWTRWPRADRNRVSMNVYWVSANSVTSSNSNRSNSVDL